MRKIGNYTVEEIPLGQGGMGQVLRGTSPDGSPVAIKEILPQFVADPEYRHRIEGEIRFLQQFNHPGIVRIYDHFEHDKRLYIVMELVEGKNLEEYINAYGPIDWRKAIGFMMNILNAMAHVHSQGVIHRDIKPGNIMIRPDESICILDFGVAKSSSTVSTNGGHTVLGSIIGTDGYMSPEQAGGYNIDRRADIYALGCVFFYMLTGRHAYPKLDSDFETQYAILNKPFPRLNDVRRGIPDDLQRVIDKAVDRNMMKRFQSCEEFLSRLQQKPLPEVAITIGRENCDWLTDPNNNRVSRYHAELKRREINGVVEYIYTDKSANGTMINGQPYTRDMQFRFGRGERPEIWLAGDRNAQLDLNRIIPMLDMKAGAGFSGVETEGEDFIIQPDDGMSTPPGSQGPSVASKDRTYTNASSLWGAIGNCFNRYADFGGRSGRGEFWWWQLFLFIINLIFGGIALLLDENYMSVLPAVGASVVWSFVIALPSMAVAVRRLHDTGKSAWFYFGFLLISWLVVPVILLFVWWCQKGQPGVNKYGVGAMKATNRW